MEKGPPEIEVLRAYHAALCKVASIAKDLSAALSKAEATSAPVSDVEGAPAFCEKYCHEDDHWCMRKAGRQCRTALRTSHGLPGEAIPQTHIITLRNHADKLAEQYGKNAGIVVTLRAILSRLSPASREDGK